MNTVQHPLSSTDMTKKSTVITRVARLSDHVEVGRIAAETYLDTSIIKFLAPRRLEYYSHYERGFIERAMKRMLDPRNLTVVVYEEANPGVAIGYAQLARYGNDEGAMKQIESRKGMWLSTLNWLYWGWCSVVSLVTRGDKSANQEALEEFMRWGAEEEKEHWEPFPERKNRWHVQSCVVRKEFQGRGAGKLLMGEVIKRAEEEGVVVGLEATGEGERLYRSVGFELLGRFKDGAVQDELDHGGVMMYTPRAMKGK